MTERASRSGVVAIAAGASVLAAPLGLRAQSEDPEVSKKPAPEQRAQSFEAVEGAVEEDVPGGPLLVLGYGIVWLALLLYLFRLVRLQQRAQGDLARLEQALAREPARK
jgi:CcmD family protein